MMHRDSTFDPLPARPRRLHFGAACALLCLLGAGPALGAEEVVEERPAEPSRLRFYGFLTQGFGVSDGDTVVGIPESGTVDYRTAALQIRYLVSERGSLAVQLAHERLGESPRADMRDEVELDWAFYQHRLTDSTELKVGRVPIPRGIYNEILDVGTALPFYRPPLDVYGESAFASEAVDGAVLSQTILAGDWMLKGDVYYGGWEVLEVAGPTVGEAEVEDAVGIQVWARPPVPGLRVGIASQSYLVSEGMFQPPGEKQRWRTWVGSLEWAFPRTVVRGEVVDARTDGFGYLAYYGQVGFRLTPSLTLNLQAERAYMDLDIPPFVFDFRTDRTETLGLSYAFTSDVVAKAEVHRTQGYSHTEGRPAAELLFPSDTTYGILSLATSF